MTTETDELEAVEYYWKMRVSKLEEMIQQQTRIEMVIGIDKHDNHHVLSIERITMTANGTRIEVSL